MSQITISSSENQTFCQLIQVLNRLHRKDRISKKATEHIIQEKDTEQNDYKPGSAISLCLWTHLLNWSFPLSVPQRGADTLRADTTDRWVWVQLFLKRPHVLCWLEDCKCRVWLHSVLSVPLQVFWLRKLRSSLHEEGRRADSAGGLDDVFLAYKSVQEKHFLLSQTPF